MMTGLNLHNDMNNANNIIITFNSSLFHQNPTRRSWDPNYNILIIGIVSFNGYQIAKYLSTNISQTKIIGIDSFDIDKGVELQRNREQELIRLSVTVIRGNMCNYHLLSQIIQDYYKYLQIVIIANNVCFDIYITIRQHSNNTIHWLNASSLINSHHNQYVHVKSIKKTKKKYLLMTSFYIFMGDPMHGKKTAETLKKDGFSLKYNADSYWGIMFIRSWYETFKNVSENKTFSQTDIVIIHDGLNTQIFQHYPHIKFVNMAQYPKKKHQIRPSANDIRYYHFAKYLQTSDINEYEIVILTDLRDVKFGKNPWIYLENKNLRDKNKIYVGSEMDKKDNETLYWRWQNHMFGRMDVCFEKHYVNKTRNWILSENGINLNPGIIASNKHTMMELLGKMKEIFNETKRKNENCNFVVYQIAAYNYCIVQNQCELVDDVAFHSSFGLKQDPHTTDYVIYHK